MNWSKASAIIMVTLLSGIILLTMHSCNKKKTGSGGHTLYDSIGGSVLVPDPADSGQTVQQGWLGIRTIVDTAINIMLVDTFPVPGDTLRTISGFFAVLNTELSTGDSVGYKALTLNLAKYFATAEGRAMMHAATPIAVPDHGQPEDIAEVLSFLVNMERSYLLGQIIFADGGTDALFRPGIL